MLRSLSLSFPASLALLAIAACAGGSMEASTSVADTIDEDSGASADDDDDDGAATAADDDADSADDSGDAADDAPSDDDAATGDDARTTGAAESTGEATTDEGGETTDEGGETVDDGAATTEGGATTDSGEPGSVDLSGFIVVQTDSAREIVLPDDTIVPVGGAIVIGRDALLGEFEDFWSTSLATDVVYIDGIDNFPTCNGDETFTLLTPLRTVVDGPTLPLTLSTALARIDASLPADDPAAWSSSAAPNTDGTPGTDDAVGGQMGVPYIAEIVDATGAGNFPYEYVEIRIAP